MDREFYRVFYACMLYNHKKYKKRLKMSSPDKEIADRYVSFMNIDCYKHASTVIDCIIEVTKEERYNNPFWEAFKAKIPQAYFDKNPDEKVLYHVCASVFYIEELFEESDYAPGLEIMKKCEYDCC